MELDEVVRRVLLRHLRLIGAAVLLGVLVVVLAQVGDKTRYVADVQLVLDSPDPTSSAQSGALADTARAMATGPTLVSAVLGEIGADRDLVKFQQESIAVEPVGTSGVIRVTVTDPDRKVAVRAANAIAAKVIEKRKNLTGGAASSEVDSLTKEIATREEDLAVIDERLDVLSTDTLQTSPYARQLERSREAIVRRLDQLRGELAVIRGEQALRPEAAIIDRADTAYPEPSGLVADLVLGAMLGMVLGIGVAAVREVLSPTFGGATSLSRATGAPVLAELPCPPDECGPDDLAEVAENVQLAARTAGVGRVEAMSMDPNADISGFVTGLDQALRSSTGESARLGPRKGPFAVGEGGARGTGTAGVDRMGGIDTGGDPHRTGLVLVSSDEARVADLEPARNLLGITGWPLLGVVVYKTVRPPLLLPRHRRRQGRSDTGLDAVANSW